MKLLKKFFKPIYTFLCYIFFGLPYAVFFSFREHSMEWIESYWYVLTHWFEEEEDIVPLVNQMNNSPPDDNPFERHFIEEQNRLNRLRLNPCGQSLQERVRIEAENSKRAFLQRRREQGGAWYSEPGMEFIPRPTEDDSPMYRHFWHMHHNRNPCAEIILPSDGISKKRIQPKKIEFITEKDMEL